MPVLFKKLNLQWFTDRDACNLESLRLSFLAKGEIPLDADSVMRAHNAGILSSNWLAKRVLDGTDLIEYEYEMHHAMRDFEARMAPILAGIIARARAREG